MNYVSALAALLLFASNVPASAEMIHLYARKGDVEKIQAELGKGVDVDLPSSRNTTEVGVSPIYIAAKFGKTEAVRALLASGADPEVNFTHESAPYPYGSALHAAARWGQLETVGALIEAGADPNLYYPLLGTPLHVAKESGKTEMVDLLLGLGALPRVEQASIDDLIAGADLEHGAKLVRACELCHALEDGPQTAEKRGPTFWGLVGRGIGSVDDYEYTASMQEDDGTWTYQALNSFFYAPSLFLPGTSMFMNGYPDPNDRAAMIAYIRTLADTPEPLPK